MNKRNLRRLQQIRRLASGFVQSQYSLRGGSFGFPSTQSRVMAGGGPTL